MRFHSSDTGLSWVTTGRVPNWKAIGPRSGLSSQSSHSRRNQTPPAMKIGVCSRPHSRIVRLSSTTRAKGGSGRSGSSELLSPLWPPASQGSS